MSGAKHQSLVKRALSGHASLGLVAAAFVYTITLTGTMVVVLEKWQRWEQPDIAESLTLSPEAAQAAIPNVLDRERDLPWTEHLYIRMPTEVLPRAVVTTDNKAWYVDSAGEVVGREAHTWTEFVAALHIHLTLPIVWGMILVGALGVALAALLVTGVLAHPKIFKDAFRLRSRHEPDLARADWHNRLGVWTLPFALTIAMTGAFIGLSYAGAGTLAQAYTGGDIEPVYATIFGDEPAHNPAPAPMADIARAMETVAQRFPETVLTYVVVHDPMTKGQFVQIIAEHPRRLIYGEVYSFDGVGEYLGKVGTSDGELGRQAAASTYNFHFGNYAGLPVEIAYIVFGIALCVITSTGITLWLRKRSRKGLPTERMAAVWTVTVWGIPLALLAMAWLRFVGGPSVPLVSAFWALMLLGLLFSVAQPQRVGDKQFRKAFGIALLASAFTHAVWFYDAAKAVLLLDTVLIAFGVAAWRPQFALRRSLMPSISRPE
jgi:uncharacterized iron-regulated membrane protein